jgi:hypothetical protein
LVSFTEVKRPAMISKITNTMKIAFFSMAIPFGSFGKDQKIQLNDL